MVFGFLAKKGVSPILKKIFKPKPKTSPTISYVKPNKSDKISKHKVELAKIPGRVNNKWKKDMVDLDEIGSSVKRMTQKLKGEIPTKSGVSKGKDLKD